MMPSRQASLGCTRRRTARARRSQVPLAAIAFWLRGPGRSRRVTGTIPVGSTEEVPANDIVMARRCCPWPGNRIDGSVIEARGRGCFHKPAPTWPSPAFVSRSRASTRSLSIVSLLSTVHASTSGLTTGWMPVVKPGVPRPPAAGRRPAFVACAALSRQSHNRPDEARCRRPRRTTPGQVVTTPSSRVSNALADTHCSGSPDVYVSPADSSSRPRIRRAPSRQRDRPRWQRQASASSSLRS